MSIRKALDDYFRRMDMAERFLVEVCEDVEVLPEITQEQLKKHFSRSFAKWYLERKCHHRIASYSIESERDGMI